MSFYLPVSYNGAPQEVITGKHWFVKKSGTSAADARSPRTAASTLDRALALATANQNDVVHILSESTSAGSTSLYQTTTFDWTKGLCHLVGEYGGGPFSQRSRIAWLSTASSASDIPLFTLSASYCTVSNLQFFSGVDDANLSFNVLVSGSGNHFKNCHFAGIGHATNNAANAYSLKVTGSENVFENCVIGLDTIVRSEANWELWVTGGRNIFKNCIILTYSETSGRTSVKIDNAGGTLRWTLFENCQFINFTVDNATGQTNVFDMPAAGYTAYVYLHNSGAFGGGAAGIGSAWADTDTSIFVTMPIPNTAGGKALAAT
jgi:hypothetical protein